MLAKQLFILLDFVAYLFPYWFYDTCATKTQIKNNIMTRRLQNKALLKLEKSSWGTIWRGAGKQAPSRLPYSPCTCPSQRGWTLVQVIHPSIPRSSIYSFVSVRPQLPAALLHWAALSATVNAFHACQMCGILCSPLPPAGPAAVIYSRRRGGQEQGAVDGGRTLSFLPVNSTIGETAHKIWDVQRHMTEVLLNPELGSASPKALLDCLYWIFFTLCFTNY